MELSTRYELKWDSERPPSRGCATPFLLHIFIIFIKSDSNYYFIDADVAFNEIYQLFLIEFDLKERFLH